jgi:hypothetical protein
VHKPINDARNSPVASRGDCQVNTSSQCSTDDLCDALLVGRLVDLVYSVHATEMSPERLASDVGLAAAGCWVDYDEYHFHVFSD